MTISVLYPFFSLKGLTLESLKKEWSLLTLFGVVGVSMTGVVWYCWRLAFRNECVSWSKSAEPWNAYSDKEFKIMKTGEEKHRTRQIPEEFLEAINYKKWKTLIVYIMSGMSYHAIWSNIMSVVKDYYILSRILNIIKM